MIMKVQHITTCGVSKAFFRMIFIAIYACFREMETLKFNNQSSNVKKLPKMPSKFNTKKTKKKKQEILKIHTKINK